MAEMKTRSDHSRIQELFYKQEKQFINSLKVVTEGVPTAMYNPPRPVNYFPSKGGGGVTLVDTITQKIIPVIGNNGIFDIDWSKGNIFSIDLKKHSSILFSNIPSSYELIQVQFKNPSNWKVIEWPDTLVEQPTIKVKSETLITLVSFGDGLVHFVTNVSSETGIRKASEIEDYTIELSKIKTVSSDAGHVVISGGKSSPTYWGALNNIAGKLDLSKIVITKDFDLSLKKIKNVKRITLAQENQTPADNGSIYLAGKDVKVKSNDMIITLSDIPNLLKRDFSNMFGTIPMSKLSPIDISKLKSVPSDAGHVLIAGGKVPNYYGTLANIAGNLPASKITGLASLNRIINLYEFVAASGGKAAQLNLPLGTEIKGVGALMFNTNLKSEISIHDSVEIYKTANTNKDFIISSSAQKVYDVKLQDTKTLSISRPLLRRRQSDGRLGKPYTGASTLQLFSNITNDSPNIKLVSTNVNPNPSSRSGALSDLGAFGMDLQFQSGGKTYQKTMVQYRGSIKINSYNFPDYKGELTYKIGDQVSYIINQPNPTKEYFIAIRDVPNSRAPSNHEYYWKKSTNLRVDSGIAHIEARNIDPLNPLNGKDTFEKFFTMTDEGIDVHKNTLKSVGAIGFTDFGNRAAWIYALGEELVLTAGYDNTVSIAASPLDNIAEFSKDEILLKRMLKFDKNNKNDKPNKVPEANGEINLIGDDVKIFSGGDLINISQLGGGSSGGSGNSFNPASISVPLLPAHAGGNDDDERLGSSSNPWNRIYGKTLLVDEIFNISSGKNEGIKIGNSSTKVGFFGKPPSPVNSIQKLPLNTKLNLNQVISKINEILDGSHGLFKVI